MKKAIIAKKLGMTQIFSETGEIIPVTVLEAGPCHVVQIKTIEKDGYEAIQVGFGAKKEKNTPKPQMKRFENAGIAPVRIQKEFRLEDISAYTVGAEIKADLFAGGEKVDVHGVSKGKGFQGVIKRFNQHRGPMAHGSKYHRAVGSMSASSDPSRVFKGKHLPGHMGAVNCTVQNLTVVRTDAENNMILLKGAVPGVNGSFVFINDSIKGIKA